MNRRVARIAASIIVSAVAARIVVAHALANWLAEREEVEAVADDRENQDDSSGGSGEPGFPGLPNGIPGNGTPDPIAREHLKTVGSIKAEVIRRVHTLMTVFALEREEDVTDEDFENATEYAGIAIHCMAELIRDGDLALCERDTLLELKRLAIIGMQVERNNNNDDDWDD